MEGPPGVLPDAASTSFHLLDGIEDEGARLVPPPRTLSRSLPTRFGSPSGYSSLRSGPGAGRPSWNTRGISRARDLVLQSIAAKTNVASWSSVRRWACTALEERS